MRIMMKQTVNFIVQQATMDKEEYIAKIGEIQNQVVGEKELYIILQ